MRRTLAAVAVGALVMSFVGIAGAAALQPAPWNPRPAADFHTLAVPTEAVGGIAADAIPPQDPTPSALTALVPVIPRRSLLDDQRPAAIEQLTTEPTAPPRPAPVAVVRVIAPVQPPAPRPTPKPAPKPPASSVPSVAQAQAYALGLIGSTQYSCLYSLWKKESNWNPYAQNKSSGAYGIPQALPGSKMGSVAPDWRTNPLTQVKWGLGYIKSVYGTACNAWAHSQAHGWY